MKKILVTGCAGFIGYHLARRLLAQNAEILGIDNLNDYYDVSLKQARLSQLQGHKNFGFFKLDLADREGVGSFFRSEGLDVVVHLAAQAGVRYSLTHPHAYVDANLVGFANILEVCRHDKVRHLVFASSSSVYGANTRLPFSVRDPVDHPISLYAATKRANELMAHVYAHLYGLPCTGVRFFTIYGPWGRPDMALFKFTKSILEGKPIDVFHHGNMRRDFTYISDAVEAVIRLVEKPPQPNPHWAGDRPDPSNGSAPFRIFNVGDNNPVDLGELIRILEKKLGKKAATNLLPLQPGDVPATSADIDDLVREVGFRPQVPIEEGVGRFVDWYREYYQE